jgi:hypothetical protein
MKRFRPHRRRSGKLAFAAILVTGNRLIKKNTNSPFRGFEIRPHDSL